MKEKSRLVYSSDPLENVKCPKCKELKAACTCIDDSQISTSGFVAVMRLEKQGRGGKTVTVIDELPKQELFLKELVKELKNKCGTGGTYSLAGKEGLIELQGDRRDQIRVLFGKKGLKIKG